jgi:hypothetical protein
VGLSIHYKGRLKNKKSLPLLIDEVKDVAEVHRWPYEVFESEFPAGHFARKEFDQLIYGILFTPPGCEPVSLTFLSNGKLVAYFSWLMYSADKSIDADVFKYWISVKTQYAGAETHKIIIHLFDYLRQKYFRHFHLMDEGLYWETRDALRLEKNFNNLSLLLEQFDQVLKNNPYRKGGSFINYLFRMINKMSLQARKSS